MQKRETTTFSLTYKEQTYTFLHPADSEALLEEITDEQFEEDEYLPYWAELWPSSLTALDYLPTVLPKTTPILEIGAGLGVVSTILAKEGFTLFASDYAEESCDFMQLNSIQNKAPFSVFCSDWRTPCLSHQFEAIVGIDILYEERWIDSVLGQLVANLSPTGTAYIYDPHRSFRSVFVDHLKAHPILELAQHHATPSKSGKSIIDCYEIRRS